MKVDKNIKRKFKFWGNRIGALAGLILCLFCPFYCTNFISSEFAKKENKLLEQFNAKEKAEIINIEKTWGPPSQYDGKVRLRGVEIDYAFYFEGDKMEGNVYLQKIAISHGLRKYIKSGIGEVYVCFDSLDLGRQVLVVE